MSELPYMPVAINDEIAETSDLTNEELGALTRIKWALWKSGGYLPDDSKKLARIARAGSRWGKVAPAVLALLTVTGGIVSSPSLLTTLLITRERRAKKVKAGTHKFAKPEVPLNLSNPLISHDVGGASAAPLLEQSKSKLKYNAKSLLRSRDAAASSEAQGHPSTVASSNEPSLDQPLHAALDETLYVHGTELLVTRVGVRTLQARAQICRWLTKIDAEELALILAEAEAHNLKGPPFINVVDDRVDALAAERVFGGALRFPLTGVKRSNGDG